MFGVPKLIQNVSRNLILSFPVVSSSRINVKEMSQSVDDGKNNLKSEKEDINTRKTTTEEDDPYARFPGDINPKTGEKDGPRGPEPTRYGDWERKGRCIDF